MKYIVTSAFTLFLFISLGFAQDELRFQDEIEGIKKRIVEIDHSEPLILFVGSSSIRLWEDLEKDMSPLNVFNAGFGGSAIGDVNDNFSDIVVAAKPAKIVFYCGENDIADLGLSSNDVLANFQKFYDYKMKYLPDVPVYFLSIKPSPSRWNMWDEMVQSNELIRKFSVGKEGLTYVDVSSPMLDSQGNVLKDIFIEDDLHMNKDGYEIWTEIIKPKIE